MRRIVSYRVKGSVRAVKSSTVKRLFPFRSSNPAVSRMGVPASESAMRAVFVPRLDTISISGAPDADREFVPMGRHEGRRA